MKKTLHKLCSVAAIALLAACTAIEPDTDTLNAMVGARNTLTRATACYLGRNVAGVGAYSLRLMSAGVGVDYTTSSGKIVDNVYTGSGYIILVDSLFAAVPKDDSDAFPTGTFDIKDNKVQRIVVYHGATASSTEKVRAAGGTLTVTKAGGVYTVTVDATLVNGVKLNAAYTGGIDVGANAAYINEPLTPSTLTFVMDDFSFTTSNMDMRNNDGIVDNSVSRLILTSGDSIRIVINEIIGPLYKIGEEPKRLPAGNYETGRSANNTFVAGEISKDKSKPTLYDMLVGSYVWRLTGAASFSDIWYFVKAEMAVTEAAGKYGIVITATSANGSVITATYTNPKSTD